MTLVCRTATSLPMADSPQLSKETNVTDQAATCLSSPSTPSNQFHNKTEAEFEDDDGQSGWSDLDVIPVDEQILESSTLYSQTSSSATTVEFEECWECTDCKTINNVKDTIKQYKSKCCGCADVCYIPSQTETTYQSKWDTPNDYLVKTNQIWVCKQCSSANHDMTTEICSICHTLRFMEHEENKENEIEIISETRCWICPKCDATQTKTNGKCSVCDCKQPTTHNYLKMKSNRDLVFGFCRYYFAKEVPVVMKYLIANYFVMETFSGGLSQLNTVSVDKKWIVPISKRSRYYHHACAHAELFSNTIVDYPNKHVWKVQLNADEKYVVKLEGDTSASKVYDVCIGVTWTEPYEGHHMISGRLYPMFRNNDVIIVELDCVQNILSFGINEHWYGVEFDNLLRTTISGYRLYIKVKQQGAIVSLIN
eukprot:265986_1